jgi:hypothetical protein
LISLRRLDYFLKGDEIWSDSLNLAAYEVGAARIAREVPYVHGKDTYTHEHPSIAG